MAIDVAQLRAKVGLDASDLERGVQQARGVLGGLATSFGSFAQQAAASAAGFIIRDVVVASYNRFRDIIHDTTAEMVDANRQWEQFETQIATQLRSQTAAAERLAELEEFAILTPFNLDDVIQADITLQNFGLHSAGAAEAFGRSGAEIRTIAGDVAAGVGVSFGDISMWLGRFAAGDTGQAIMRMQELGVTTRSELAEMGVEFNKSGALVSPLDEAMTALLAVMERKFGGMMDTQSRTLGGMESNLEDWMDRQRRLWGEPVFDEYREGLGDLLGFLDSEAVTRAMEVGQEMWAGLVDWVGDVAHEWAAGLGGLAVDALYWGANIVEQFAAGIEGSDAVAGALNDMAREITDWLQPGSPPRLLPELTEWGYGAAAAYWEGWAGAEPEIGGWLRDAYASLEPHLREIEQAGGLNAEGLAAFRGSFGDEAPRFEGYVQAYGGLVMAAQVAAEAQLAYDAAVQEGDEEAIAVAEAQLDTAREQERAAQRRVAAEQSRIRESMSAEARLARAVEDRTRQEESAAKRSADREAEAAAKRAEAEAKRIEDSRLRWELAVAETPENQLAIWQRELSEAEEGTAEYYDTLTRIVQLEQRIRDDRARAASGGGGGGWASGIGDEVSAAIAGGYASAGEAIAGLEEDLQRTTLGQAVRNVLGAFRERGAEIGREMVGGIIEGVGTLSNDFYAWATDPDRDNDVGQAGEALGTVVGAGIRGMLGIDGETTTTADAMTMHLADAAWKAGAGAYELGKGLAERFLWGLMADLMPGDATPAHLAANFESFFRGHGEGLDLGDMFRANVFDSEHSAARIADMWLEIAEDDTVSSAVRAEAAAEAQRWIERFQLEVHEELGIMTAAEFAGLVGDAAIFEEVTAAGTWSGEAYVKAYSDAVGRLGLRPDFDWNYTVPEPDPLPGPDFAAPPGKSGGGIPGYASGGLVTEPTLAWIGEEGPELVIPLPRAPSVSSGLPVASGGGDGADRSVHIHFEGPVNNPTEVAKKVVNGLRAAGVVP